MNNVSLRVKLNLGFGVILAIIAILSVISYRTVGSLSDLADVADEFATKMEKSYSMEAAVEKQTNGVRGFLLFGHEETLTHDEEGRREWSGDLEKLQETVRSDEGKRLLGNAKDRYGAYRVILDSEIQLRRGGKMKEAVEMAAAPRTLTLRSDLSTAVQAFLDFQQKLKRGSVDRQNDAESSARTLFVVLAAVGLALGTAWSLLLSRSLVRRIFAMLNVIEEVKANNLGVPDLIVTAHDEIGRASLALNEMKNNLRGMIESIAETAEHVASASEEISASSTQQARGAETQKDQATQVATAMQEMSATVNQVSENSTRAAEASRQAAETARRGGTIVDETLAKMRAIADGVRGTATKVDQLGKASDQIGRIVGVIDDIADQTNLLALNAAIEAARAGEQGRGFAAVADEVRKLAERTTGATKEIAQMIKSIQGETRLTVTAMEAGTLQVEDGVKSTAQAGEALKEIIRMAEQVGEMVAYIATASTEQSSATEQVNQNMDQIARLVRGTAVGSLQAAKACQDLSNLALDLQKMVQRFRFAQAASSQPYASGGEMDSSAPRHAMKSTNAMAATAR